MFWVWLAATLVMDLIGMTAGKKFAVTQEPIFMAGAILSFAVMGYTMTKMVHYESLATANIIWSAAISIILILISVFYFQEKISPLQILGIFVILAGIALLEWPTK